MAAEKDMLRDIMKDADKVLRPEALGAEEAQDRSGGPAGVRPTPDEQRLAWTDKQDAQIDAELAKSGEGEGIPKEKDVGNRQ